MLLRIIRITLDIAILIFCNYLRVINIIQLLPLILPLRNNHVVALLYLVAALEQPVVVALGGHIRIVETVCHFLLDFNDIVRYFR